MKKGLILLILVSFCCLRVSSSTTNLDNLIAKASKIYFDGNLEKSFPLYKELIEKNCEDGKVWYQLGYIYQKTIGLDEISGKIFAVANYYCKIQYPDHDYTEWSASKMDNKKLSIADYKKQILVDLKIKGPISYNFTFMNSLPIPKFIFLITFLLMLPITSVIIKQIKYNFY